LPPLEVRIFIAVLTMTTAIAAATSVAAAAPILSTGHGCYLVGQRVSIQGSG